MGFGLIFYGFRWVSACFEVVDVTLKIVFTEKKREEPVKQETRARQIVRTYHSMHSIRRPKNAKGKLPWLARRPISSHFIVLFHLFFIYFFIISVPFHPFSKRFPIVSMPLKAF